MKITYKLSAKESFTIEVRPISEIEHLTIKELLEMGEVKIELIKKGQDATKRT